MPGGSDPDTDQRDDAALVPTWFRRLSRWSWGFLGIVGATAVVVLLIAWLRELTIPLILAAFLAVVFAPVVDSLERRNIPRGAGSAIVIVLVIAVSWAAIAVVVYGVIDQTDELTERLDEAQTEVEDLIEQSEVDDFVQRVRDSVGESGAVARDGIGSSVGTLLDSAVGVASGLVLGTVLLYYLVKDGAELSQQLVRGRAPGDAEQTERILNQSAASVRGYFKGKTILAAAQGVAVAVAVALMGVPLAGAIGIVNFIGAYIPYLGAFVGGAFAVLIALSEGGIGLALAALAVVLAANLILENALEPRLLGSSLDMHPIVVLLATVAGGVVAGMVGLILAAPLTAIGINLYRELKVSGFFDEDG